jgi:hypothetical protein
MTSKNIVNNAQAVDSIELIKKLLGAIMCWLGGRSGRVSTLAPIAVVSDKCRDAGDGRQCKQSIQSGLGIPVEEAEELASI